MKTTVEISDALLLGAKKLAADRQVSFRVVLEESLSQYLAKEQPVSRKPFKLRHNSFGDPAAQADLPAWPELRDLIYGLPE